MFRGLKILPRVDFARVQSWLRYCEKHHAYPCRISTSPRVPQGFRVIDCVSRKIVLWESVNRRAAYLTLSYVWGNSGADVLVDEDVIPRDVPNTINDAMHLTRELGYLYLWIDRYCIPQNDPPNRQFQIQSMDKIYEQCALTIVAAAGFDPHYGLPGVGERLRTPQPRVNIGQTSIIYAPLATRDIQLSKWNSRGWTYQEGLLSNRKLVFTDRQVYFQCMSMTYLESISVPLGTNEPESRRHSRQCFDFTQVFPAQSIGLKPYDIEDRINEYLTGKTLTNKGDLLDAFKGVLSAYERKFPSRFRSFYGIPFFIEQNLVDIFPLSHDRNSIDIFPLSHAQSSVRIFPLLHALFWKADKISERRSGFPSWSWLGWTTSGIRISRTNLIADLETPISDIIVQYLDGNVLSWTISGSAILVQQISGIYPNILQLDAPAREVKITANGSVYECNPPGTIECKYLGYEIPDIGTSTAKRLFRQVQDAYGSQQIIDGCIKFTYLHLYSTTWSDYHKSASILILHNSGDNSIYERVGSAEIDIHTWRRPADIDIHIWGMRHSFELEGWTRREVRIS